MDKQEGKMENQEDKQADKQEEKQEQSTEQQDSSPQQQEGGHSETKDMGFGSGRIISVQGPVVDIKYDNVELMPPLFDILKVDTFDGREVQLEVAEHLAGGVVRTISLSSTFSFI